MTSKQFGWINKATRGKKKTECNDFSGNWNMETLHTYTSTDNFMTNTVKTSTPVTETITAVETFYVCLYLLSVQK